MRLKKRSSINVGITMLLTLLLCLAVAEVLTQRAPGRVATSNAARAISLSPILSDVQASSSSPLSDPTSSADSSVFDSLSAEKSEIVAEQSSELATASEASKPPVDGSPSLVEESGDRASFPTGVIAGHAGPFPRAIFDASNSYRVSVKGSDYLFFAGVSDVGESQSDIDDANPASGEGAVRVYTVAPVDGASEQLVGTYALAAATAPLTIDSGNGSIVNLTDAAGTNYSFDLATDSFSS